MNNSQKVLSDIIVYNKYAKYRSDLKRRETYEEIIDRYIGMMLKKYTDELTYKGWLEKSVMVDKGSLAEEIIKNSQYLYSMKVLPSMRALQFAGPAIEKNHSRIFNCSYLPVDDYRAFSEIMFLLLGGSGVGYSVQYHHIEKLPEIQKPSHEKKFLIGDSIEGWADAVKALMKSFFGVSKYKPRFDYSDIRPKGSRLVTAGGKAPGPEPLRICLTKVEALLNEKRNGSRLAPIEIHDIICHIADAVLAGGIRRAALISLFSFDDVEMATCKHGSWWELNPQRGRANNSAVIVRNRISESEFKKFWKTIKDSNSGEPGIYFTNDSSRFGTNPCKPLRSTILTAEGYITFEEALTKNELEIITPDGRKAKASKPFVTGINKEIYEITLGNKQKIHATDNHLHQLLSGGWVPVSELNIGDKLKIGQTQIYDTIIENQDEYNKGLIHGWMLGDGWSYIRSDSINSYRSGLSFGIKEFDVIPMFEKILNSNSYPHEQKPDTCKLLRVNQKQVIYKDKWNVPFKESSSYKLGFIRSLFTTDGSVRNKNNNVELYSINIKMLEDVSLILQEFGIQSSITTHNKQRSYIAKDGKRRNNKTTYKINVYGGQFKKIGFLSKYKQELLDQQVLKKDYEPRDYEIVTNIEYIGNENVYDITVYDPCHSFIDKGIIAHNCAEISLREFSFCNLTEINGGTIESQEDFNERARVASFFGTLQAGFTDFHYLRSVWKNNTEKDSLIGVGITGIANGNILDMELKYPAKIVKDENKRVAEIIGINPAARTTTVKPAGTTSSLLGVSSGIHAWHGKKYIRNIQCAVNDDLYIYFLVHHPELMKLMDYQPGSAVIGIPIEAPEGAITRNDETAIDFLERVKKFNLNWVREGHNKGPNFNNVSATCNIKEEEWADVEEWMWKNRDSYNGISVLPYDGGTYVDAPFQETTDEEYDQRVEWIESNPIDLTKIVEEEDNTNLSGEVACGGGQCELILI